MKQVPEWNKEVLLQSPLFAPLHPILSELAGDAFPSLQDCNALLASRRTPVAVQSGMALRFVAQERGKLPFEAQYEPRCYLKGEVPTRADNWHDLLNALVWLTFPKAKAAINARHYEALMENQQAFIPNNQLAETSPPPCRGRAREGVEASHSHCSTPILTFPLQWGRNSFSSNGQSRSMVNQQGLNGTATRSQRGAVRDVNTLLDESGVIVACADAELAALLRNFQWRELFWQRREQVMAGHFAGLRTGMGFYLFGHGLYEKALNPYIGMTGQGLLLAVEPEFFNWLLAQQLAHLDDLLAAHLAAPGNCRSTRDLAPVPLLGVPGWAAENADAAYYDNTAYFRPGRRG